MEDPVTLESTVHDRPMFVQWAAVVGAVLALHAGLFASLAGAYPVVGGGLSNFINTEIEPIRVGTQLVAGAMWVGGLVAIATIEM